MKKINYKSRLLLSVLVLSAIVLTTVLSCNKKFDSPPGASDPAITPTHTLAQLKALHTVAGQLDVISTDMIVSGVVIANDKSGNLYKQLFIQDASGALQILLDANSLFNTYPVGRKIFINCKGLCISDDNNMMELGIKADVGGTPSIQGIPAGLISQYVTGGSINNTVSAKPITDLTTLGTGMQDPNQGLLIELTGYEFFAGDTAKTYSDTSAYKSSINRSIKTCDGSNIIVRTSAYANFAGVKLPGGNGKMKALYTVFKTTKQLVLRDLDDVTFTGLRCNLFEEDFEAYATTGTAALSIPGWSNIKESGDVSYTLASFSGSIFPKVSAFTSAQLATTDISSWLVSPGITLPGGGAPKLTFTSSRRYPAGTFKVYVATTFNGSNVSTADWTLLTTVPAGTATAFTPFDPFGPFDLSAYAGKKIYIGFNYKAAAGTTASSVGTYEVDNIKISK
jgi:hypothetical protein